MEISILRCERGLRAIAAQALLFVPILGFDLVWLYFYRDETDGRGPGASDGVIDLLDVHVQRRFSSTAPKVVRQNSI
jgi:hypothetical protein